VEEFLNEKLKLFHKDIEICINKQNSSKKQWKKNVK